MTARHGEAHRPGFGERAPPLGKGGGTGASIHLLPFPDMH